VGCRRGESCWSVTESLLRSRQVWCDSESSWPHFAGGTPLQKWLRYHFFFFFFLVGLNLYLQSRHSSTLSHASSSFCSSCFGDGVLQIISLSRPQISVFPTSASQVARMMGLSWHFFSVFEIGSCCVAQAGLELLIFLPQSPEYWDCRYSPESARG
jgi:hypothetical protein